MYPSKILLVSTYWTATNIFFFFLLNILRQGKEEEKKCMRPASSYGSMRSDSDIMEEEEGLEEETAESCPSLLLPEPTAHEGTGYCVFVR